MSWVFSNDLLDLKIEDLTKYYNATPLLSTEEIGPQELSSGLAFLLQGRSTLCKNKVFLKTESPALFDKMFNILYHPDVNLALYYISLVYEPSNITEVQARLLYTVIRDVSRRSYPDVTRFYRDVLEIEMLSLVTLSFTQ